MSIKLLEWITQNMMKYTLQLFLFLGVVFQGFAQLTLPNDGIKMLALGDSYTIGQSVDESERWPTQLKVALEQKSFQIESLKYIAVTGWRTDNLLNGIEQESLQPPYDLVTLLIGVNDYYQGGTDDEYVKNYETCLLKALELAGNEPSSVLVLSIPDYAYTPFGGGNENISKGLDAFNAINDSISAIYSVPYVNITDISRRGLDEPDLVANDNLHPSGKQYSLWVERILDQMNFKVLSTEEPLEDTIFYPNPVEERLFVEGASGHYKLFNLQGQLVQQGQMEDASIEVFGLEANDYLLVVGGKTYRFRKK